MRKLIIPLFALALLFSCDEDELLTDDLDDTNDEEVIEDDPTEEEEEDDVVTYESEAFADLTTADFDNISTPYEEELGALSGARRLVAADALAETIEELFDATLVTFEEGVARGLSVYDIKILLSDGSVLNVTVVQDIYEILSIEAIPTENAQDEVAIDGFISLAAAIETSTSLIDGEIVRWEISIEEDNVLEFEIHIISTDGSRYEIELDATTGDVIAQKLFENEEDAAAFETEAEEEASDDNPDIATAVANFITADILFASTETDEAGTEYWDVLVETTSGALVHLSIDATTKELIAAEGEEGPFDYDMSFLTDGVSFAEQMFTVEGQSSITVDSWSYYYVSNTEFSYWALAFYSEDEIGNKTTIIIHAASGEWISGSTTPSDEFMEQLAIYTSAEIQYAYRYENEGNPFWDLTLVNESDAAGNSGAIIKALIYEAEFEILRAFHDNVDTSLDYEFTFGGEATVSLSEAIAKAEDHLIDVTAGAYYWEYDNSVDVEETSYRTIIISLSDPNQTIYTIYIDVDTGNIIKEESF